MARITRAPSLLLQSVRPWRTDVVVNCLPNMPRLALIKFEGDPAYKAAILQVPVSRGSMEKENREYTVQRRHQYMSEIFSKLETTYNGTEF
jgi:hypothetical protein